MRSVGPKTERGKGWLDDLLSVIMFRLGIGTRVARVVVIGGGMAGSAMALFSGRRGHEVLVVDRDPGPPEGDADELARWDRSGVVQAGFSHYFLARSTRIVRQEAPDLLEALDIIEASVKAVF